MSSGRGRASLSAPDPERPGDLLEELDDPVELGAHPRGEPPHQVERDHTGHTDQPEEPTPAVEPVRLARRAAHVVHSSSPGIADDHREPERPEARLGQGHGDAGLTVDERQGRPERASRDRRIGQAMAKVALDAGRHGAGLRWDGHWHQ